MEEIENTNEREIEVRGNGTQVFTEPYSEAAISRLKNLILSFFAQGERKYYSIAVDGETVVAKNCDGRKFDRYLTFLSKQTQNVEVKMYQGLSPNCNKYQFTITRILSGIGQSGDMQTQIDKALEEQRILTENENLRNEIASKNKKLKKLKENSKGININGLLEKLPEIVNAYHQIKNPGLAGTPEPQAEVKVEAQSTTNNAQNENPRSQEIYDRLYETYGEKGIMNALKWMEILKSNPDIMDKIREELIIKQKNENGKA